MVNIFNTLFKHYTSFNSTTFWLDYPPILFTYPHFFGIIPWPTKNYIYNLNALTRIFIILIILALIQGNIMGMIFFLILIGCCVIIYKVMYKYKHKDDESKSEKFLNIDDNVNIDNSVNDKINKEYVEVLKNYMNEDDEYNKKFKFYNDPNNIYNEPIYDNIYNIPIEKQFNNLDKLEPLKDNKDQQYLNNSDAYSFINNDRMDMPKIKNDKIKFANWLYKGLPNCKTDQYQCIKDVNNLNIKTKLFI